MRGLRDVLEFVALSVALNVGAAVVFGLVLCATLGVDQAAMLAVVVVYVLTSN